MGGKQNKNLRNLFPGLGIYGLGNRDVEDILLAALITGDPVLLVGRHGSAKTLLVRRIAEALGLKFISYDASQRRYLKWILPEMISLRKENL
jgi:MoxR-like ATPase